MCRAAGRAAGVSLALLLLAVTPASAARRHGAHQKTGIVPLSANGAGAPQLAAGVVRAIVNGLRAQHHAVTVLDEGRAARLRLCLQQPSCTQALGTKFGLAVLITGHVERQGNRFQLDLRAVSGRTGEVVGSEAAQLRSAQEDRVGLHLAQKLLIQAQSTATPVVNKTDEEKPEAITPGESEASNLERGDGEDPLAKRKEAKSTAGGAAGDREHPVVRHEPVSFGRRYWPSITFGAIGIAAVGVAAGFGVVSKQSVDRGRDTKSQIEANQLLQDARQNAMVANILFGAGGAALAVSAVLLIFEIRDAVAERRSLRAQALQIGIAANGAGIHVRGEF